MAPIIRFRTLKSFRYVILALILILIFSIYMNIGSSKGKKDETLERERSNVISRQMNSKNYKTTELPREISMKNEQKEAIYTSSLSPTGKVHLVNPETFEKTILFPSEYQTSCLKKYELSIPSVLRDPLKVLELVTKNVSEAYMFTSFHRIAAIVDVKFCIIEPSILYCMLPTKYQELLVKRNFSISNFIRSQHVVTFGILENDVPVLQKEENILEFRNIGLQPDFVEVPLAPWMKENSTHFVHDKYTSHIFYTYYKWTFHVVVFYKRNGYLWHAALESEDRLNILPDKDFLFINFDSAYENFNFDLVVSNKSHSPSIYVPSSPHFFLFQITSSRFLECNLSRAVHVLASTDTSTIYHPYSEFRRKTIIALREMKAFFNPLLMNFWIFSGTMLGWYRQCDIIPYTTDVDFAAWISEMDDLSYFTKYFRKNKILTIRERMGILEEALEFQLRCGGLRVDLFFMYKISNGTWCAGHRPEKGYYFRYYYPFFNLCSADFLQQKVQVPCETEDLIVAEYGKEWMYPISYWGYETSIKNRGPNIYWDEEKLPKAFKNK